MYIAGSEPTDAEKEVWTDVNGVLTQSGGILEQLRQYKGAANEIREVHDCTDRMRVLGNFP